MDIVSFSAGQGKDEQALVRTAATIRNKDQRLRPVPELRTEADALVIREHRILLPHKPLLRFNRIGIEIDLDTEAIEPQKRLVWEENTMFANYEGICLGPELKNGTKTLVLVSDGGGSADESLLVLALPGGK